MKLNFFILVICITTGLGWMFYQDQKPPIDIILSDPVLKNAPSFESVTLQNKKITLRDYHGRVTLIHFWATWCAPCLVELPTLIDLAQSQQNLTILAIAVKDKKEHIDRFLKKIDKTLPDNFVITLDPDKNISKTIYDTIKLPESYLLTRDHKIFRKIIGAQEDWNSAIWEKQIKSLQISE